MRCKKAEKWVSDGIDGRLSEKKRVHLESHLAACASCRAYQESLRAIHKESQILPRPQPASEYWQDSISRLKAGLQAGKGAGIKVHEVRSPSFLLPRKWAWAGAAALLIGALGLYLVLTRPTARPEFVAFSFEDAASRLDQEIAGHPELEKDLDSVIQDSIDENIGDLMEAANPFRYENPLFLESLNEEELQALDSAIQAELKL